MNCTWQVFTDVTFLNYKESFIIKSVSVVSPKQKGPFYLSYQQVLWIFFFNNIFLRFWDRWTGVVVVIYYFIIIYPATLIFIYIHAVLFFREIKVKKIPNLKFCPGRHLLFVMLQTLITLSLWFLSKEPGVM